MTGHRWSGWPGAFCQDCFIEDQCEICISDHDHLLDSKEPCPTHKNPECPGCPVCHRSGFGEQETTQGTPKCQCGRKLLPSGFSLVELMIIVAIVGILVAIFAPTVITYRNRQRCGADTCVETAEGCFTSQPTIPLPKGEEFFQVGKDRANLIVTKQPVQGTTRVLYRVYSVNTIGWSYDAKPVAIYEQDLVQESK